MACLRLQIRSVLGSFSVVLMPCKVNFHVARSAWQSSMCLLCIFLPTSFPGSLIFPPKMRDPENEVVFLLIRPQLFKRWIALSTG